MATKLYEVRRQDNTKGLYQLDSDGEFSNVESGEHLGNMSYQAKKLALPDKETAVQDFFFFSSYQVLAIVEV